LLLNLLVVSLLFTASMNPTIPVVGAKPVERDCPKH